MHLLVTNDFPPKVGGIQSYLWELWRRLDPSTFVVLTSPHRDAAAWDATQPFRVVRTREPVLLPHPWMARRVRALAAEIGAHYVVIDPAVPLGLIGPHLRLPYAVVVHGAEISIPGRLPIVRPLLAHVLRRAGLIIAAGGYPAAAANRAARRTLPTAIVPPGVDPQRFVPLTQAARDATRLAHGLDPKAPLVVSVSRLVPRKGIDVVIRAVALLRGEFPELTLAVAGSGRDRDRLERIAREVHAPVRFLGRVAEADLPAVYGCGDVFAMLCRSRWGGLEQEGFGIVFIEAAAAGVPQIAGASGGAADAVVDGTTGVVVGSPRDVGVVAAGIAELLRDPARRSKMAVVGRQRAVDELGYDVLASRLATALASLAPTT